MITCPDCGVLPVRFIMGPFGKGPIQVTLGGNLQMDVRSDVEEKFLATFESGPWSIVRILEVAF